APQLEALRSQLAEGQAKVQAFAEREVELTAREKGLEARIAREAEARAQTLFAADRQALELQLTQKSQLIADLRSAELSLRTEKSALEDRAAALEIEVARKLDAGRAELETRVRTQERERAD